MLTVVNVLTFVLVLIGAFMTFLIMLQEGKGGGLASLGGTKAAGVEGVTNPVRRATGWMAGMFFILAVALAIINGPKKTTEFISENDAEKKTTVGTTGNSTKPGANAVGSNPAPGAPINMMPAPKVNVTPNPAGGPTMMMKPSDGQKPADPVKPPPAAPVNPGK